MMLVPMRLIGMMAGFVVFAFLVQSCSMFMMFGSRPMVFSGGLVMLCSGVFIRHYVLPK